MPPLAVSRAMTFPLAATIEPAEPIDRGQLNPRVFGAGKP
jgi:hypothetical protein